MHKLIQVRRLGIYWNSKEINFFGHLGYKEIIDEMFRYLIYEEDLNDSVDDAYNLN